MLGRTSRLWLAIVGATVGLVGPVVADAHAASWHLQTGPSPSAGAHGQLMGVSCPSASMCLAVGWLGGDVGPFTTLGKRWNGSTWTQQSTPNVSGSDDQGLESVSCTKSTTACTAVGFADYNGGPNTPLVERYNGTSWSIQPTPFNQGTFDAVSCPSTTGCIAVGQDYGGGPFAARWNGSTWTQMSVPVPSGSTGGSLVKLSCRSMTWCEAVGWVGANAPLVEHFNGTTWSLQTPPPGNIQLNAITCPSTSECFAGGSSSQGVGIWRFNGSSWITQSTPVLPSGGLDSLSCASANACTATGFSDTGGNQGTSTLAERWNGSAWSVQPTPNPLDPTTYSNELYGVACPTTTTCEAVGYAGSWMGDVGFMPALTERYY